MKKKFLYLFIFVIILYFIIELAIIFSPPMYRVLFIVLRILGGLLFCYSLFYEQEEKKVFGTIAIVLPLIGILLFLFFAIAYKGEEKKKDKLIGKTDSIFDQYCDLSNLYKRNSCFTILANGDKYYPILIKELKAATKIICLESYIIRFDEEAIPILEILREKALNGVKVYVIYDSVFSNKVGRYYRRLKEAKVNIASYSYRNMNYRNHSKIVVIDERIAFLGGINLGKEYIHKKEYYGFWRDTQLTIKGKAICELYKAFLIDWYNLKGEVIMPIRVESKASLDDISIIRSIPGEKSIYQRYFDLIMNAKEEIIISTPYFAINDGMLSLLKEKARSVRISILLPGKPDKYLVNQATKGFYFDLVKSGIDVYEYTNVFNHSKYLIIDSRIASIGTVNFDCRSFFLNTEITALITGDAVNDLIRLFRDDLSKSRLITEESLSNIHYVNRLIQGVLRLFYQIL